MIQTVQIALDERAVVLKDGVPLRALGPGSHTLWGFGYSVRRWAVASLVFDMPAEMRRLWPDDAYEEITLTAEQRGVLWHDARPKAFLVPGTHRFWQVDGTAHVQVFSVHEPMPALTAELAAILPQGSYVDATVLQHERGLLYVQGRLVRVLDPGRYAFWSTREAPVTIDKQDLRSTQITIAGQELMTRDKVTLRLSLTIEYAIVEPSLAVSEVANLRDAIYLVVQLAARQYLAGVTLDDLLGGRDTMTRFLEDDARGKAQRFGVRIDRVGVKDVVLPGEMKTLLNKVIEAEKEAAANVILRREETAATRSLANTAKVIAEQPILLRLRELESLKEIASKVRELRVVTGAEGLGSLLPKGLLDEEPPAS